MSFDRNAYQRDYMRQRRARLAQQKAAHAVPGELTPRQLAQRARRERESQEPPQMQAARLQNVREAQQLRRAKEAQAAQGVSVADLSSLADRVAAHVLSAHRGQVTGAGGVCAVLAELSLDVEEWTRAIRYLCEQGRAHIQEPRDIMGEKKFVVTA